MAQLQKTKTIKIWGNDYEVTFPKTGQFIDIQTLKAKITEGYYDAYKLLERDGIMANVIVDTIATFNILIPKLKEDLNVPGLMNLELEKIIELAYIFNDEYRPWYEEWIAAISNKKQPDESKV